MDNFNLLIFGLATSYVSDEDTETSDALRLLVVVVKWVNHF